jgi:hypothetical protein
MRRATAIPTVSVSSAPTTIMMMEARRPFSYPLWAVSPLWTASAVSAASIAIRSASTIYMIGVTLVSRTSAQAAKSLRAPAGSNSSRAIVTYESQESCTASMMSAGAAGSLAR